MKTVYQSNSGVVFDSESECTEYEKNGDPALGWASKSMSTRTGDLPNKAVQYMQHFSRNIGMCADVCLTAYAHYAQDALGLKCYDEAYKSHGQFTAWIKENPKWDNEDTYALAREKFLAEGGKP